jgi:hypothetical protein
MGHAVYVILTLPVALQEISPLLFICHILGALVVLVIRV